FANVEPMPATGGRPLHRRAGSHSLSGVLAMKRWPYIPLALTLAGSAAIVCCPDTPEPAEPDTPSHAEAMTTPDPETVVLRNWAREQIAREAAAGRRSLVEAAALFRKLNRLPPEWHELLRLENAYVGWALSAPVHTEEERLCRQVVQWVDGLRLSKS